MLAGSTVAVAALVYMCCLFAVAQFGDAYGARLMKGPQRALIYACTLAIYCTSWTFLGSVGLASRSGLDFFAIYLGPILVFLLGGKFIGRILRLAKAQNITSVADFIASRFGKNERVAALVALIAVIGIIPYIALQLKAISSSLEVFVALKDPVNNQLGLLPGLNDLSLAVTIILAAFAAAFGTRHIDATEHQDGLMFAIAMESAVKLVAFLAVGAFVTYWMFDGFGDLVAQAQSRPTALLAMNFSGDPLTFLTMTLLSSAMILLLPRQFHVAIVENRDAADLKKAIWLFPLYLVVINIFVVPITMAGQIVIPQAGFDRDMTVLALPMHGQSPMMAMVALIGGLSAATAMIIVECVALAIMVSNHLAMPLLLRRGAQGAALAGRGDMDMGGLVLAIRRATILVVMLLAYAYYKASGEAALAAIGLMSFAAIAQIAPAFIGGLAWRGANARGATAGLTVGILAWAYTLLLPSLATPGSGIDLLVTQGPFGIAWLRPTALFGLSLPALVHGVGISLGLNILALALFSRTRVATPIERLQANIFVAPDALPISPNFRLFRASISMDDLQATVKRYLGEERTSRAFSVFAAERNQRGDGKTEADIHTLRFAEHLLSSAIGAASSRLVLSLLLRRRNVSTKAALKLLDDASAAIQYSRDLLQNALDHAGQGVTVFDRHLQLTAWNRAFQDLFQIPPELLRAGVGLDEIVASNAERGVYGPGDRHDFIARRLTNFVQTGAPFRLRIQPGDRVIEIRTDALPDGGFVTTYTEITSTVRAEEALERANETLERRVRERTEELTRVNAELGRAKAIADDANISKTRFLAAASHDILQPLNAARLYTSALVDSEQGAQQASLARNIDSSLEAVEDIITALLDISRLDAGAMKPEWSVFPIDDIFRQLRMEFAPLARAKGLKLVFVPSSLFVRSDRRLMRRLLQNLISNAVKYTESGKIVVGCKRRKSTVRLIVRDSGIGIPSSKQKLVFREFQRLDQGARIARGLGLGLSIVERIARVCDHKLSIASQPGRGSTFTVELPIASPAPVTLDKVVALPSIDASLAGLCVLTIDNEPAILDSMRQLLEGWGCIVMAAGGLKEARGLLKSSRQRPQVLIADYHLDRENGIDAVKKLRVQLRLQTRAILVTADRSPQVRDAATRNDILVLNKPLRPAALRATLAQWRLADAAE